MGSGVEGEDDANENLGQIINSPAFQEKELSPPIYMIVTITQTSAWEHHIPVILKAEDFFFLFLRDVVVSIGLFKKKLLGIFFLKM